MNGKYPQKYFGIIVLDKRLHMTNQVSACDVPFKGQVLNQPRQIAQENVLGRAADLGAPKFGL